MNCAGVVALSGDGSGGLAAVAPSVAAARQPLPPETDRARAGGNRNIGGWLRKLRPGIENWASVDSDAQRPASSTWLGGEAGQARTTMRRCTQCSSKSI